MRTYITGSLIALLSCSSCIALDRNTSQPSKPEPVSRATAFAGRVAGTLTELLSDLAPLAKAVVEEATHELPGDLTKLRADVFAEMSPAIPSKKNSSSPSLQPSAVIERVSGIVTELVGTLAPAATGIAAEVSRELPGIVAKFREGLFEQRSRAMSSGKDSSPP